MSHFRFKIVDDNSVTFSDWVEENFAMTGTNALTVQVAKDLRQAFPTAALTIERDQVPPMPTPEHMAMVREKWMKANNIEEPQLLSSVDATKND